MFITIDREDLPAGILLRRSRFCIQDPSLSPLFIPVFRGPNVSGRTTDNSSPQSTAPPNSRVYLRFLLKHAQPCTHSALNTAPNNISPNTRHTIVCRHHYFVCPHSSLIIFPPSHELFIEQSRLPVPITTPFIIKQMLRNNLH